MAEICKLKKEGILPGSCAVEIDGEKKQACRATLKRENNRLYRLITSVHLSRPENYLSIYQSGCNFSCKKCHSWYFSKIADGSWYSPQDILEEAISYEKTVTLIEPREKATAWHAHDTCRCCGCCVLFKTRSDDCPAILDRESIVLSPQGYGPVRNIVAFTGGDITCCPEFYGECAELIKGSTNLHVLIETNGYGLTDKNLDYLRTKGVDAFWLDIKAFDSNKHKWLTGCTNEHILLLPEKMKKRNFVLEVLSLYIPKLIETGELKNIAELLADVDPTIPFTILAFFPEYRMKRFNRPTVEEMIDAYKVVKKTGLKNIRLGNVGVFAPTDREQMLLKTHVDEGAW